MGRSRSVIFATALLSGVLLTFAFLSLIPVPLILILGITILIIWHYHKKDILAGKRQTR